MSLQPVVVNLGTPPKAPFRIPHIPEFTPRATKIVTALATVVISISMVAYVVFSAITNSDEFKRTHNISQGDSLPSPTNGVNPNPSSLPSSGVATGVGGTTGTNSPKVTMTAEPANVPIGGKATIKWSVTNNPESCEASDDWQGSKSASGQESTRSLTEAQTYIYTLTCKTKTGTGFAYVSVGVIKQSGTGNVAQRPSVTLAATPSSVFTGQSASLSWSSTNNASSCTASGDWSGVKVAVGVEATPRLTTPKTYTYSITCKNSAGTGTAQTSVRVVSPPRDIPVVDMETDTAAVVTAGTRSTITWNARDASTCKASGNWSGTQPVSGTFTTPALAAGTYTYNLTCSGDAGSGDASIALKVVPAPPKVILNVSPSPITVGSTATLTWTVSNSPESCTASGDWSGAVTPASSGSRTFTPARAQTYLFNLSCTNDGGDGFANNISLVATLPSAPVVSINANPISVRTGGNSNLTWTASNNPTSCTASGSGWAGSRGASGTVSTGALNTNGTYTYTLSCSNAGGTGTASTSVSVSSGTTSSPPALNISVSPTTIGAGSSATVSWSATNSPTSCTPSGNGPGWTSAARSGAGSYPTGAMNTPGTYTYSLVCSNAAGSSGVKTATLTVSAVPVVTLNINPKTVTASSSATATLSWTATNSPTSCTAGGNWSGTRSASGTTSSFQVGPISSAGVYTYTLVCSNTAGTGPVASVSLTASAATAVYCGGNTPCYGPSQLATHASASDCYGYNLDRVINVTTINANYHNKGRGNLLPSGYTGVCGNVNLLPFLNGTASIPSIGKHNHGSGSKNNTGNTIKTYFVGYYDAAKP